MNSSFSPHRDRRGSRRRLRSFAPRLEVLEDRCVPSTVNNLMDSGPGSLRQAIADTPLGGTVGFQPGLSGTITLTSGELQITRDLTIAGPGADVITVSGNHASRVFGIFGALDISGLNIADGSFSGGSGGGIFNGGTLTLTNCTLSGNSAIVGGAIINGRTLTLTGCTVSGNFANSGSGIVNQGTLTVTSTTFSGNTTPGNGGAIENGSSNTATVTNSTFSGNSAGTSGGGGIWNSGGMVTLTSCTLSGNSAPGGFNRGGGIFINGGMLSLTSCTLSGNSTGTGGGIYINLGTVTSRNTIVAGNSAPTSPDVNGALNSQGYNLIGDGTGGSGFAATDLVGTSGMPIDPLLGPLQGNGGPTQTMALLPGSPALNAGDPGQLGTADQRGVVRRGGVNIGAYQASATALVLAAPNEVDHGSPFALTVTAVDPFGQVAVGYNGTITFSTRDPDPFVVLPADYTFQPGDAGQATFGVVLMTPGGQTVSATDTADNTIAGIVVVVVA
jgi:predicted outer membrane repeat protein